HRPRCGVPTGAIAYPLAGGALPATPARVIGCVLAIEHRPVLNRAGIVGVACPADAARWASVGIARLCRGGLGCGAFAIGLRAAVLHADNGARLRPAATCGGAGAPRANLPIAHAPYRRIDTPVTVRLRMGGQVNK